MLRKTAAGAAADAAATVASSSPSKCGPDFQLDHKHSIGTGHAAKRPQAQQRRRSVSERTMLLAAAIAGSMVFSLARHFWLSASSSPAFFSSTSTSPAFARGLADPAAPSSLSASTILSTYGLFHPETQGERRYDAVWAEARAHATNVKLEKKAEKKKKNSKGGKKLAATATEEGKGEPSSSSSSSPPRTTPLPAAPPTLAYVTPWNPRGFEAALKFHKKITHVSPVWYQIVARKPDDKSGGGVGPVLRGGEGVDEQWLAEMRKRAPGTKILPRVSLELDRFALALLFGGAASHALSIGRQLDEEATRRGFDGWVLEAWPAWTALSSPVDAEDPNQEKVKMLMGAANGASLFVKRVAAALHDHDHDHPMRDGHAEHFGLDPKELAERAAKRKRKKPVGPRAADDPPHLLALAVPPPPPQDTQPQAHEAYVAAAERLHRHVDLWSLMSYDFNEAGGEGKVFSPPQQPAEGSENVGPGPPPNAPLPWVRASALALARAVGDRKKVLTGVPFYAVSWDIEDDREGGTRAITARDAVTTLEALERIRNATSSSSSPPKPLQGRWDELAAEASFDVPRGGGGGDPGSSSFSRVWMPTLPAVEARLRAAAEVGTGLAIWELGQGADAFFDLL